jgi:hypothetical protein
MHEALGVIFSVVRGESKREASNIDECFKTTDNRHFSINLAGQVRVGWSEVLKENSCQRTLPHKAVLQK